MERVALLWEFGRTGILVTPAQRQWLQLAQQKAAEQLRQQQQRLQQGRKNHPQGPNNNSQQPQ
jgi:hypothetical protein